jgi:hypothetical protein
MKRPKGGERAENASTMPLSFQFGFHGDDIEDYPTDEPQLSDDIPEASTPHEEPLQKIPEAHSLDDMVREPRCFTLHDMGLFQGFCDLPRYLLVNIISYFFSSTERTPDYIAILGFFIRILPCYVALMVPFTSFFSSSSLIFL